MECIVVDVLVLVIFILNNSVLGSDQKGVHLGELGPLPFLVALHEHIRLGGAVVFLVLGYRNLLCQRVDVLEWIELYFGINEVVQLADVVFTGLSGHLRGVLNLVLVDQGGLLLFMVILVGLLPRFVLKDHRFWVEFALYIL